MGAGVRGGLCNPSVWEAGICGGRLRLMMEVWIILVWQLMVVLLMLRERCQMLIQCMSAVILEMDQRWMTPAFHPELAHEFLTRIKSTLQNLCLECMTVSMTIIEEVI